MANEANLPFANALAKTYPAPEGVKIFTASAEAEKMLAFWSVKQTETSSVLRIGEVLFRVKLHACPGCGQHLSASALRMSKKEREMLAALASMLKAQDVSKPAGKVAPKQAKPVVSTPAPKEPFEPNSADDMTLEQLEALTSPGGGA